MKRKIAGTPADCTLPKTPVTLNGRTYDLCLDLGALSEAEAAINRELGSLDAVNLLLALPVLNLGNVRTIFAAALRTFHPEISFEEGKKLIGVDDLMYLAVTMRTAWQRAMPEAEGTSRPPRPGE